MRKNDLSKCKVGDYIWTIFFGWKKVTNINRSKHYPILVNNIMLTIDGRVNVDDLAPVAFTKPPKWFKAEPMPYSFEKGDKVLVKDIRSENWVRQYFSHYKNGKYYTSSCGCIECIYNGSLVEWSMCKKLD